METLLKWMIWGYHYFRKHPYMSKDLRFDWQILFGPTVSILKSHEITLLIKSRIVPLQCFSCRQRRYPTGCRHPNNTVSAFGNVSWNSCPLLFIYQLHLGILIHPKFSKCLRWMSTPNEELLVNHQQVVVQPHYNAMYTNHPIKVLQQRPNWVLDEPVAAHVAIVAWLRWTSGGWKKGWLWDRKCSKIQVYNLIWRIWSNKTSCKLSCWNHLLGRELFLRSFLEASSSSGR